jgi:hypothetical protein
MHDNIKLIACSPRVMNLILHFKRKTLEIISFMLGFYYVG